jgi:hypothetical protein
VTANVTALLSFMLGATETSNGPEVAPAGIVIVIAVALHELILTGRVLNVTTLPFCVAPKPVPLITTWLPASPVVADRPVMTGAGEVVELTDTLSNVAVPRVEV